VPEAPLKDVGGKEIPAKSMAGLRVANQHLLEEKRRKTLNEHIAPLAGNSNVRVYLDPLQGISIAPVRMFSVRYIALGGKIVAIPPVYPREERIQYLQNKARIFR
jgi:hypothetical protein